jgi:hypothetical protein
MKHPIYKSLDIIVAHSSSDEAVAGAFYVPVYGDTLSQISVDAYGMITFSNVMLINRSKYNREHCIYRASSSNCGSKKVSGSLALSQTGYGDGAWLSLCNVDKYGLDGLGTALGTAYQVIWVPTQDGLEPGDLDDTPGGEGKIGDKFGKLYLKSKVCPDGVKLTWSSLQSEPACASSSDPSPVPKTKTCPDGKKLTWMSNKPEPACPETSKAGFPWWLALILGGGALVTMIMFNAKKKKK